MDKGERGAPAPHGAVALDIYITCTSVHQCTVLSVALNVVLSLTTWCGFARIKTE